MYKYIFYFSLACGLAFACSSCTALKSFISTDLEDEDFIVGQLYADEYVEEKPYVPQPTSTQKAAGKVNALGIERETGDNEKLYDEIQKWMGTPYKYGGTDRQGVDCSGFVGNVYLAVYQLSLHRTASDMQKDCRLVSKDDLREGDIVFFTNSNGKVSHVGIYLKKGLFAHSSTSRGVIISRLDDSYWSKHFYKGGRTNQ